MQSCIPGPAIDTCHSKKLPLRSLTGTTKLRLNWQKVINQLKNGRAKPKKTTFLCIAQRTRSSSANKKSLMPSGSLAKNQAPVTSSKRFLFISAERKKTVDCLKEAMQKQLSIDPKQAGPC